MNAQHDTITVAIDARVPDTGLGGVQQVIRSLAIGFSELGDASIQRVWIVYKNTTWWKGTLPPNDVIIELDIPFEFLVGIVSRISPRIISVIYPIFRFFRPDKAFLDKTLISHGVDVVHLPFQDGLLTELPTIYHPHDLQHEYLPKNFSWFQRHHRNTPHLHELSWLHQLRSNTTLKVSGTLTLRKYESSPFPHPTESGTPPHPEES